MKKLNKKNRKGFTLVELVVVILIIAILASATFLGGATVIKQSRVTKAQNDLRLYAQYAQDALYENPSWAQNKVIEKVGATITVENLNGYLTGDMKITGHETELKDAWDNAYSAYFVYEPTEAETTPLTDCAFVFASAGPDAELFDAAGYDYDDVITAGAIKELAPTDFGDDLVTVVYLNEDGEVSVVSNAQ